MVEITLFGSVSIRVDGAPISGDAAQRRRVALLALLASPGFHPLTRDRLIGLLWAGSDDESARHLLSAALHVLRKALGTDAILATTEDVALNPAVVQADVETFRTALAAGDDERAIALRQGEFLAGFYVGGAPEFEHWVDGARAELDRLYAEALERAAAARARQGRLADAAAAWQLRAALDPYDARVALSYMRALAAAGQRAAAIRHARLHAQLLEQEFNAAPDPDVLALAESLKLPEPKPDSGATPAVETPGEPALSDFQPASSPPPPAPAASAAPVIPVPLPALRSPLYLRALLPAAVLVLILAVTFLLTAGRRGFTVAVHPFAADSGTGAHIGVGLAEELIPELDRIDGVRVVSRALSFPTRGLSPREAIRALDVDAVLCGTMHPVATGWAAHVELVLADGTNRYNREHVARDVAQFKHAIVDSIARSLGRRVRPESEAQLAADNVDPRARDLQYQGRAAWLSRTPDALRTALGCFEQARRIDPSYAAAHVGVADALNMLGSYDYSALPPDSAYPAAESAVRRALELNPELADAHAALGNIQANYRWDLQAAELSYQRAIRGGAEHTAARQWYALLLAAQERFREANEQARSATEQEPTVPLVLVNRAHILYYQRRHAAAREFLESALRLDPRFSRAHLLHALNDMAAGNAQSALAQLDALRRAAGADAEPVLVALHGYALANVGRGQEARTQLALLRDAGRKRFVPPELLAIVHVALGEHDAAFRELRRAYRNRSGGMLYLRVEPLLDPLRNDARFAQLVRDVGV